MAIKIVKDVESIRFACGSVKKRVLVRCDCGTEYIIHKSDVVKRDCCSSCSRKIVAEKITRHGQSRRGQRTKLHSTWKDIRKRCENPGSTSWDWYGGKGIRVCEPWQTFETFAKDMGEPPTKQHTIDRIDVNGDYCPENCRWATRKEQSRNQSSNRIVQFRGQSKTLAEWCEILSLPYHRTNSRLNRGWTPENSFEKPQQTRGAHRHNRGRQHRASSTT